MEHEGRPTSVLLKKQPPKESKSQLKRKAVQQESAEKLKLQAELKGVLDDIDALLKARNKLTAHRDRLMRKLEKFE